MKELNQTQLQDVTGGEINNDSTAAYDVAYLAGWLSGVVVGFFKALEAPKGNWHSGMMGYSAE